MGKFGNSSGDEFKKVQVEAIAQIKQAAASSGVEIGKASTAAANNIVNQLESVKESSLKQFNASIEWEARTFAKKEVLKQAIVLSVAFASALGLTSYWLIPKATTDLTMQRMLETFGKKVDKDVPQAPEKSAKKKHH